TGPLELLSTSGDVTISGNPRSVSANSTSGDVEIAGSIPGRVQAKSTSGDVHVGGAVREGIAAEVVSGDIEITANSSEIVANAVSGSILLSGAANRISTATVSGDTEIRTNRINYGAFESVSGDIRFEAALEPGAALTLTTHSGEVEAVFPSDVSADFRATTFSGRIQNEFGGEARRTSRYAPGSELRFSTGNDGVVVLKSFSGAIRIRKQ
ncbi:MAG TPA: DUF4097 family beta strand repeat-containing protein, partial [Longimicrobiaceae bacterium]|nr:DUF4097 family beta strand repeat-containing protein [Longimicrobiaceae bacterium]